MDLNSNIARLLKKLVDDWMEDEAEYEEYYLELALTLVHNPNISRARWERELFHKIREELGPENWQSLPKLIQEYRTEVRIQKEHEREAKQRAEEERKEKERQKQDLLECLNECFEQDFLNVDNFYQAQCTAHVSREEYETKKNNYVQSWATNYLNTNAPEQATFTPDSEQAAAIGAVKGNIQVVARAGSGKTATLVNRALFLQQYCGVSPDKMLLLAFNRKAADEMRNRLASYLPDATPHVMTFHALAYAMVRPGEILFDEVDGEQRQSRAIQDVIDDHLRDRSCHNYYNKIRDLMIEYFRGDWERIVLGGYHLTPEEMLRYRRSLPKESLDGKYFKSFGEKVIADFLFEHDINYSYMRDYWSNDVNYCPDFTHFTEDGGIVIECFGPKGTLDYDPMSHEKRNYWRTKSDWRLLEFFLHELASDGVEGVYALLKQRLEDCGIPCNRLSEEEIWNKIKDRAIDRFTGITVGFIRRCRKLCLTPEQLSEKVDNHDCVNDVEKRFLDIAQVFYKSYLERLQTTGEDDFDGLIQKATERVDAGKTDFCYKSGTGDQKRTRIGDLEQLRYMLIDEYQDFSELFYRLMQAVRVQNPHVRFFCVGDDWQAIYGFAGADLRFFENFAQFFQDSHRLDVATNYRSAQAIVDVGNALMEGRGTPARAHKSITGNAVIADLGTFEPTLHEEETNPSNNFTPAVLRLVNKSIKEDKNVVLLSRKNSLPWYVNYSDQENPSSESGLDLFLELVHDHFPEELKEKVTISTVHKYKGLQEDVVILLDAIPGCYPLIHPDLIFTRIFGDSVETVVAEERRLFYVALTRAVEDLFILTEADNFSPFLVDLETNKELPRLEWAKYPQLVGPIEYITIRINNQDGHVTNGTFAIKDRLKDQGYKWNDKSKTWYMVRPTEGFPVEEFVAQARQTEWGRSANGIVVRFCDHLENEIAKYHVNGGKWNYISGNIDSISQPPANELPDDNIISEAPFSVDFEGKTEIARLKLTEYPEYLRIKVGNQAGPVKDGTFAIRELIKDAGYVWYDESEAWETVYSVEGFLKRFANHAPKWSKSANGIVVRFYDHLKNEIARYHIDGGQWNCIFDNIPEPPVDEPPDDDDIPF